MKNAPFRSCISKFNNTSINNAQDPDITMPMYNLLECANYSITSESLWNYYKDKVNYDANENDGINYRIINNKTATSKSFDSKTKSIGRTTDNRNRLNTWIVVSLKYLSNSWRSLDLPLINCEIELDFLWSRGSIKSETSRTASAATTTTQAAREATEKNIEHFTYLALNFMSQ